MQGNRPFIVLAAALFLLMPGFSGVGMGQSAPLAKRAMIISIDGLRPDVMLRARTPNLRALCAEGSFTFWARTTEASITLPSHVSMLSGVTPKKHRITWNDDGPTPPVYPQYPTLLDLAHGEGRSTALVAGKSKFASLARPGSADHSIMPPRGQQWDDSQVTEQAIQILREHRPQVMVIHFPHVDATGHKYGWGSIQQIEAVERVDADVGQVMSVLRELGLDSETLIIVSADHGGAGRNHGPDDARSRHIPWIAVGPGIRKNWDLTQYAELQVNTEDTFATACLFLGIAHADDIDGRPVTQMLEEYELLRTVPTPPAKEPTTLPAGSVEAR